MAEQSAGPSIRTPGISTPFPPMSPLPSMDVLMHSPGLQLPRPGLVISRVEAALAELAGLGKELTEAGVSFLPSSVRGAKAEPDGEFAAREWDALVAERKAKDEMDNVRAALRKVHLQLRQRFEDDREMVWEIDKVMKGLSAADPDRVSGVLRLLRENGVLEGGEPVRGGSIVEQLERVQKAAGWMEMELVGETGKILWHSSGGGSAVAGSVEGEGKGGALGERPACLRCLLPGVLRATVGVSKEGQPTTVFVTETTQATPHHNGAGHNVFSDVTNIATSALFHFKAQRPESALERFLVWLASYRSLFTQRCSACGKVLAHDPRCDMLLPPVMRPFKAILASDAREREAFHSFCHLQRLAYF